MTSHESSERKPVAKLVQDAIVVFAFAREHVGPPCSLADAPDGASSVRPKVVW